MKKFLFRTTLVIALLFAGWSAEAANPTKIAEAVKQIVAEFDGVSGVDCIEVTQGSGLGLVKAMFKQQFGKDFMQGVTSMIVIDYTKASQEVYTSLRKKIDGFSATLQEFELEAGQLSEGQKIKSFAKVGETSDAATITDMIIVMEDGGHRMCVYMSGVIKVAKSDL